MLVLALKYIPAQVFALQHILKAFLNILRVDGDLDALFIGRVKGYLIKQALHDRVEPAGPDILRAIIHLGRDVGDLLDRVGGKIDRHLFRGKESDLLFDERVLRLGQDPDEFRLAERIQLHPDRKPALKLWDQVGWFGNMERARGDEQDMVGPYRTVLGRDRRAFDDRQEV